MDVTDVEKVEGNSSSYSDEDNSHQARDSASVRRRHYKVSDNNNIRKDVKRYHNYSTLPLGHKDIK